MQLDRGAFPDWPYYDEIMGARRMYALILCTGYLAMFDGHHHCIRTLIKRNLPRMNNPFQHVMRHEIGERSLEWTNQRAVLDFRGKTRNTMFRNKSAGPLMFRERTLNSIIPIYTK